jgi:hypothetical protein
MLPVLGFFARLEFAAVFRARAKHTLVVVRLRDEHLMRGAFAACLAFAILVVVVAVHFGSRDSQQAVPALPLADAAVADAPIDAAPVIPDAAPQPKKRTPKPAPKRPAPKPAPVIQKPVIPEVVITPLGKPRCTLLPNPSGCPVTEPNVNRPCDAEGVHCVYSASCCPIVYVCNHGAFEAWFSRCP